MFQRKIKSISKLTLMLSVVLGIILLCFAIFLYQRRACLSVDLLMCLSSKSFVSKTVHFSFRYPNFFPLSQPDEEWEINQARDSRRLEVLDFSTEFYFNAGGDRLGWIEVSEKSDITNINDYEKELLKPVAYFSSKEGREVTIPVPDIVRVKIGNGIEALSISPDSSLPLLSRNSAEYVFFKDGLQYQIAFSYNDYHHKLPKEQYFKGFELILATLRI